jgi:hypothetical protein
MTKAVKKLGIGDRFLSIMKTVYDKPTDNTTTNKHTHSNHLILYFFPFQWLKFRHAGDEGL